MKVFVSSNEYNKLLINLARQKPERVDLSTFSLYAGITGDGRDIHSWGGKYEHPVGSLFDELTRNRTQTRIIIGSQERPVCFEGCEHCENANRERWERALKTSQKWNSFDWRIKFDTHMKLAAFIWEDRAVTIVGGRNLSGSSWDDLSFQIDDYPSEIRQCFESVWSESYQIEEFSL